MTSRILIIDNYDSFTYNLVHYVKELTNLPVDVYRNDKIDLESVNHYDYIILSPGPGLPKDAGLLKSIIKTYGVSKKILGVCLGMQAIAEVYGNTLLNLDKVYHGVSTPIHIEDYSDPIFKNIPSNIYVGRYHSWIVKDTSPLQNLQVTSRDDNQMIMSLKHKTHQVYGVQFHPESILTEHGKTMIKNFITMP